MSAETDCDMANGDMAFLLAEAADEVEIGMAPVQAVMRGGRRRRARRWAVGAAAALAIATGSLAVAGLQGGDGNRVVPVATPPPTLEERNVSTPQRTLLASGTEKGKKWMVFIDVWPVPRDDVEAEAQFTAMAEYGGTLGDVRASDLIGKSLFLVRRSFGDTESKVFEDMLTKESVQSGKDIQSAAIPLEPGSDGPFRLVIGHVAKTAQRVTCTWKDGTAAEVRRLPEGHDLNSGEQAVRSAEGSPVDWFVCLAPEGTASKSVEVTG